MSKLRHTWVDKLTVPGVFAVAAVGHFAAVAFSGVLRLPMNGPLISLATGVSVGLVLAANLWTSRIAALAGGVFACVIGGALSSQSLADFTVRLLSHSIEAGAATIGLLILLAPTPKHRRRGPWTGLFAQLICILAAFLGAIPILFYRSWGLHDIVSHTLAHGIGLSAMGSTIIVGRFAWISTRNPRKHIPLLAIGVLVSQALVVFAALSEPAVLFISLGLIALIATTFGSRAGAPLALGSAVVFALAAATNPDSVTSSSLYTIHGFTGAAVVLTSVLGRIADVNDKSVVREKDAAKRIQKLAVTGFDGFIELDKDLIIVDASDNITAILRPWGGTAQGESIHSMFSDDDVSKLAGPTEQILAGETIRIDRRFQVATGETRSALALAKPEHDKFGQFDGCMIFIFETTDVHQVNSDRLESKEALADALELERARMAQLVHDGALQDFAAANLLIGAIKMNADWIEQIDTIDFVANEMSAKEYIDRIESLVESGMRRLRLDAIGPNIIDIRDVDIRKGLEATVAKFAPATTASVELYIGHLSETSPEQSRALLQIGCEALINAIVHSGEATAINVDLRSTRDGYSISVIDDGVGFDSTRIQEIGHLGLNSMTALALQAGGWCTISTRLGRGTTVEAWLPKSDASTDVIEIQANVSRSRLAPK